MTVFHWQYQYPLAFYLLAALPFFLLLFLSWQWWKRRRIKAIGDPVLIRSLFPAHSRVKTIVKFLILLIAFGLGCITLANPRVPDENSAEARKGIDLMIALDVSNSMLATDVAPSRLIRAKLFVTKLVDRLQDDRIGLVIFAGNAYRQMPLTFDRSATKMYISAANPGVVSAQGTSISDALEKSDLAFGEQNDRFRSIVVITDGESHDDDAVAMARKLAGKGVMINTVGLGSVEGATIMDTATQVAKKDENGQVVISKLNEQLLQQVAAATNGTYVHMDNSDDAVAQVIAQYAQIEKKALGDTSLFTYTTYYSWLAIPMLALLLVELFISDRKRIRP